MDGDHASLGSSPVMGELAEGVYESLHTAGLSRELAGVEMTPRFEVVDPASYSPAESHFGLLLQYPATDGAIHDHRDTITKAHDDSRKSCG